MTHAQQCYLAAHGIDPWSLQWADAMSLGFPSFGLSEAAWLPDGRVLLADGTSRAAVASLKPKEA